MENLNAQTQIKVNNFPDSVRENPDVYIQGSSAPLSCFSEILANSVDEHKEGYCFNILVAIDKDDNVMVQDDGRGIPVAPCDDPLHKGYSQAEVALTVLSAGGKFGGDNGYKDDTGGKNGMGSSCVNALSSMFTCEVQANGHLYQIKFEQGRYVQRQKIVKDIDPELHGTIISYHLDPEMFSDTAIDRQKVIEMCQQMCFLNNGLRINVAIENADGTTVEESFCYEDGMKVYLDKLLKGKQMSIDSKIHLQKTIPAKELPRNLTFNVAFGYVKGYTQEIVSFVNSIPSEDGGSHVQGFALGIRNAIRKYALEQKKIKNENDLETGDCNRGATGIIAVKYKKPSFDRQSKTKLDMPKVRTIIAHAIEDEFYDFLEKSPKEAEVILEKALMARKERLEIKKARERVRNEKKGTDKKLTLGKLADCISKDPAESELWVTEGDSAGGSAKEARDRNTQAILPIFGKVLNTAKSLAADVLKNDKLGILVSALGCGIGDDFDESKLRYDKIMIFSDADPDGAHIQTLYIVFFWIYMPDIIRHGHLYIPQPPLFRATKKGQEDLWFYTNVELKEANLDKSWEISRFKGLGEMRPEQLWDTSMNPETRILRQITVQDAEEKAAEMVEICMGEAVAPRKELIFNEIDFDAA